MDAPSITLEGIEQEITNLPNQGEDQSTEVWVFFEVGKLIDFTTKIYC